ncbi:MAG: hypothetical protein L6R35_007460 [Caloplaca aegaea]|nr:MAG: hypothetical protein L6R35_007460 [Caloplaca aegaea]
MYTAKYKSEELLVQRATYSKRRSQVTLNTKAMIKTGSAPILANHIILGKAMLAIDSQQTSRLQEGTLNENVHVARLCITGATIPNNDASRSVYPDGYLPSAGDVCQFILEMVTFAEPSQDSQILMDDWLDSWRVQGEVREGGMDTRDFMGHGQGDAMDLDIPALGGDFMEFDNQAITFDPSTPRPRSPS